MSAPAVTHQCLDMPCVHDRDALAAIVASPPLPVSPWCPCCGEDDWCPGTAFEAVADFLAAPVLRQPIPVLPST